MSTIQFRASKRVLDIADICALRPFVSLSLSELRTRAESREPHIEITPFVGNWRDTRVQLARLVAGVTDGSLPLVATEQYEQNVSALNAQQLTNRLVHLREIELETQRDMMLEVGEIADPAEFKPYDDDWTLPKT